MIAFIVPGFGMPTDFENDPTYISVINKVVAHISNYKNSHRDHKILVIFSGGNSDLDAPYLRTEAEEMHKMFGKLAGDKLSDVVFETEKQSLSSLDNLLYSQELLGRYSDIEKVIIFVEETRLNRTKVTAEKVFSVPVEIVPLQLYSDEQLKDIDLMMKKEELGTKYSLWALQSLENLVKSREQYAQKFKLLRGVEPSQREAALKQWWKDMLAQAESTPI